MDWNELIEEELKNGTLGPIRDYLEEAYAHTTVYPAKENIFRALEMTPLNGVKVVILGQDPYHEPGQAQGYSFSVPSRTRIPPSLVNIYKELSAEYGQPVERTGNLSDWAAQGVLLLNSILTVEQGKPLSHSKIGWQKFTDDILRVLNRQDQPIVFLLWGGHARKARALLDNPNHLVLECAHPSPLSANRGFFGCNHFIKANEFLEAHGVNGIHWAEDNRQIEG